MCFKYKTAAVIKMRFTRNKSSYFRVKLKRIKFELYTEPDLDQT